MNAQRIHNKATMPPSIKEEIIMGNTEPSENDDLDDYFASDSLERSSTAKVVTKQTLHTMSTNDRTAELAKLPTKRPRRSNTPSQGVRFSNVETREYERIVGDHDDLLGPPLAIGWSYNVHEAVDMDKYEEDRANTRKPEYELILTPNGRRHLLMNEFGISADHITQAERMLAEQRRTNELAASASEASARKKKERSGSILKRARRKIGKRLSLERATDIGSSLIAMSGPFSSVYASAR